MAATSASRSTPAGAADAREVHAPHLEGVERIPAELERGVLPVAPRLPVDELEAVRLVPVAEVGRGEDPRPFPGEGADVLDQDPPVGGRALDLGQERQPVEVPEAADHVIPERLPLAIL